MRVTALATVLATAAIANPTHAALLSRGRSIAKFTVTESTHCVEGHVSTVSIFEKDLTTGHDDEAEKCHTLNRDDVRTAYLTTELKEGCTLYWYRGRNCEEEFAYCPANGECTMDAIHWGSWRASCSPSYQPKCSRIF